MLDKQAVYELAKRAIRVCHNDLFDPTRAGLFVQQYGFPLPTDLLEWLQTCNGGRTYDGKRLYGLIRPGTGRLDYDVVFGMDGLLLWHSVYPRAFPDPVVQRWVRVAEDEESFYLLTCEPDEHGAYWAYCQEFQDEFEVRYVVASDLWHFLYGFLSETVHRRERGQQEPFWWPFDKERMLSFDPLLRVYEGTGLLPWEKRPQGAAVQEPVEGEQVRVVRAHRRVRQVGKLQREWRAQVEALKPQVRVLAELAIKAPFRKWYDASRIEAFEREHRFQLPEDLLEWLQVCNGGVTVDNRVLYGLVSPESRYRIYDVVVGTDGVWDWRLRVAREFPEFGERGWVVVASDWCGDVYVLACEADEWGFYPVCFVNHEDLSWDVVASSVWHFVYGFLLECGRNHWHFDWDADSVRGSWWPRNRRRMLAFDVGLRAYGGLGVLPWE